MGRLPGTDGALSGLLLFGLMFGGILLAIAIPEAFGTQGLVFAVVYSAMQVRRSVFTLYAFRGVNRASFLTFLRITLAGCWCRVYFG